MHSPEVSLIIPTRNRCESLRKAIASLQNLNFPDNHFEIIVIDNNSADETWGVVEERSEQGKKEIIYFKELLAGAHNARNAGARIAQGEILAYLDDDEICDRDWLLELTEPFGDPQVACVGGKIVPRYETQEPVWAKYFPDFLGLIDRTNEVTLVNEPIHAGNCAIRKSVLYDLGGFHPDAMPWKLIRYRCDGEDGLFNKAIERGYKVVYTPFAVITHVISKEKVTVNYLKQRAFEQGISDSCATIRKNGGTRTKEISVFDSAISAFRLCAAYVRAIRTGGLHCATYNVIVWNYHRKGVKYHRKEVSNDKKLFEFVLQDDYLN